MLRNWDDLPDFMKKDEVLPYYNILKKKKASLFFKRMFDIVFSLILLIILSPIILIISILIKTDSEGDVFFRQERVTQYGKVFKIFKFRTMVQHAESIGSQVTVSNDSRVTKVGRFLRKYRLDEISQIFNVFVGDMSFVGTRPEVKKYTDKYTDEMYATLLLPAGVTSEASIEYKDEEKLLDAAENPDGVYINEILPEKMKYNLDSIKNFGFWNEIKTILKTFYAVLR